MAVQRNEPYGAFNFLVVCDRFGDPGSVNAGFQEVSGLGMEVSVSEYRTGNEKTNSVRKVPGLSKATDVSLKRGVIGATDMFEWIKDVRDGAPNIRSNFVIHLLDESRQVVMTWKLVNAFPFRYSLSPLVAADSSHVAVEELVLACDRIEVE